MSLPVCLKNEPNWIMWQPPMGQPDSTDPLRKRNLFEGGDHLVSEISALQNVLPLQSEEINQIFEELKEKIAVPRQILDPKLKTFIVQNDGKFMTAIAFKKMNKLQIAQMIERFAKINQLEEQPVKEILQSFMREGETSLLHAMQFVETMNSVCLAFQSFLEDHNLNANAILRPEMMEDLPETGLGERLKVELAVKFYLIQEGYYRLSKWNPMKTVEDLTEELRQHGVMVVGGIFPTREIGDATLKKYGSVKVHFWSKNFWRKVMHVMATNPPSTPSFVNVVGVQKSTMKSEDHAVIITYPHHQSDPAKPQNLNYYAVPYASFRKLVTTNEGAFYTNPEESIKKFKARRGEEPSYGITGNMSPDVMEVLLSQQA